MVAAKYGAAFAFLALVPLGGALGGAWTLLLVGALPLTLMAFDRLAGDERPGDVPAGPYRLLPYAYIPAQWGVIGWAGWRVAQPSTPDLDAIGLTLSTGVSAGVFGFLAAHEMIHSRAPGERALGAFMLAGMLDMPFAISHVHGHHRRAATDEDPASARRGESVYAFILRSLSGQVREAWAFEARRLVRAGRAPLSLGNRMVAYGLVEAGLVTAAGLASGRALAFLLGESALAITLLEAFNYIAHYGLARRRMADGRYEPLRPRHAWNSGRRMDNAMLFNMGRHADHHRFSARPYQALEPLDGGAMLPFGYAGVLLLAFAPPLFRRVMDPRVDAVMGAARAPAPLAMAAE